MQIITFKIGNILFGADIMKVQEIIKLPLITELPGVERAILGIINLRGKIIPILDLKKKIKILNSDLDEKRVIILKTSEGIYGISIDSIQGVKNLNEENLEIPKNKFMNLESKYFIGLFKEEKSIILMLNYDLLLKDKVI